MSLIEEAWHAHRSGWDFRWLDGRTESTPTPWDYLGRARRLLGAARRVLDVDTGGGELLAGLAPLPAGTVAVERWAPNVPVARQRLGPLGVTVVEGLEDAAAEPVFDLVLNRHGRLDAGALAALAVPDGILLTQQVGSRNQLELNDALGTFAAEPAAADAWDLGAAVDRLETAGFRVLDAREALLPYRFLDIGAVVYQLAAIPWQIPGFSPAAYADSLRRLEERMTEDGGLTVHDHRFLIEAQNARTGTALG